MTAATFHLSANPVEAHKGVVGQVWQQIKALAVAGHATVVEVRTAEDVNAPVRRAMDHNRAEAVLLAHWQMRRCA